MLLRRPRAVVCDLDGVIWLAHVPIPGSVDAVARLRSAGCRVVFVTNNSGACLADQESALAAIGIPASGDVVTSGIAAAALVEPGERVLICAGPGAAEAVEARGAVAIPGDDAGAIDIDVVMVGFHREFDYERMRIASTAVRRGARLLGTNDDATYPAPDGQIPGGGAILASVAVAGGATAVVAGKPYAPMATAVELLLDGLTPTETLVVGDRLDTDGRFADAVGCPFALVRSGVTPPGMPVSMPVAIDAPDLASVADAVLRVPAEVPGHPAGSSTSRRMSGWRRTR